MVEQCLWKKFLFSSLRKASPVVGHNIPHWAKRRRRCVFPGAVLRSYGTERSISNQLKDEIAKEHIKDLEKQQKAKKDARAIDKDFFLSILGSSATKREAKTYIQRFKPTTDPSTSETASINLQKLQPPQANGVNLGSFYGPTAVQASPRFNQHPEKHIKPIPEPQLHVALVKIRAPQGVDDETLQGIGKTLSQLGRLGLMSIVVVDCNNTNGPVDEGKLDLNWRTTAIEQANRIVVAIDENGETGARFVDNVIGISETPQKSRYSQLSAHVTLRKLLMTPLRRGIIPVIPSVGYTDTTQTAVYVSADHVVMALAKELAGLPGELLPEEDPILVQERLKALREEISLDRLIILDPLGGIPATDRPNGYHVFLNMEQEFEPAKKDLLKGLYPDRSPNGVGAKAQETRISDIGSSNPLSKFVETEFGGAKPPIEAPTGKQNIGTPKRENWNHVQNLELVRWVLSILPPSSSALITTTDEAANSVKDRPFHPARVGTRRQRNPLIHNLLTDKPVFSSSLPVGRLSHQDILEHPRSPSETSAPTTFAKHGMSVTIFPDPKIAQWHPPVPGEPHLKLTDAQIDLPRLVHLIEDSFGRKLDVKDYLNRVNGRLAGVIIAGEYEGGALLTWELPPGAKDDGSPESRARMVPYLDKFAVLRRSQGSGGVADLIFKAMVRDCFPHGVAWRSRKNNPVNKWYFERSRGTWKLPNTGWTMFWTTPELNMDKQLFLDYEGVCRGIEPSWADNKALLD